MLAVEGSDGGEGGEGDSGAEETGADVDLVGSADDGDSTISEGPNIETKLGAGTQYPS